VCLLPIRGFRIGSPANAVMPAKHQGRKVPNVLPSITSVSMQSNSFMNPFPLKANSGLTIVLCDRGKPSLGRRHYYPLMSALPCAHEILLCQHRTRPASILPRRVHRPSDQIVGISPSAGPVLGGAAKEYIGRVQSAVLVHADAMDAVGTSGP
jgi:hypothetical protein